MKGSYPLIFTFEKLFVYKFLNTLYLYSRCEVCWMWYLYIDYIFYSSTYAECADYVVHIILIVQTSASLERGVEIWKIIERGAQNFRAKNGDNPYRGLSIVGSMVGGNNFTTWVYFCVYYISHQGIISKRILLVRKKGSHIESGCL